ncbi:glycosyltransferase [Cetobacterium somerae]|uniref:glycosyltransferase n=1 Tax=Cetobacterium somerae TaxID=188913 RepID=UPI0038927EE4
MIELSIVVPVYNVEKYLEECLKSIYKLNIKKEVILVNDESPDNSYLIINEYQKLYPNETILVNQNNKGLSGARNAGLEIAKGEYVAFIDSDDFIDTKKYEEFFNKGKNQDLDIIIGTYQKYQDGEYLKLCKRDKSINSLGKITGKEFFEKSMELNFFREEVWDDIYKREFLIKNNLKFKERLLHEDTLFFIQALSKAKKVEYIDIPFYIYRQREGSIMSTFSYKNYQHRVLIIKELIEFQEKESIKLKGLNEYLLNILWSIYRIKNEINIELLNKLFLKETYCVKSYIKIMIMYLAKFKCEVIEPINLEEK